MSNEMYYIPPLSRESRRYNIHVSREQQVMQFGTLVCNNQTRWHNPTKSQCTSSKDTDRSGLQNMRFSRDEGLRVPSQAALCGA